MAFYNDELKGRDDEASLSKVEQSAENMEKIQAWLAKNEGMMTLSGNVGCGKTYLCKAIYNDWLFRNLGTRFMYVTDFLNQVKSVMNPGNHGDCGHEVKRLAEANFFILDDFGATTMNDWQTEIFTDFINERYENMLPTIITTNKSRSDIYHMSQRIYSRLNAKCNLFLDLSGRDKRQDVKEEA